MWMSKLGQLSERAARAASAGDWAAAADGFVRMLEIRPGDPALMLELSYVESLAGHYRSALGWTRKVANAGPIQGETAVSLVRRLRTFNESGLLQRRVAQWLATGAEARVLVECAAQLSNMNDHAGALRCAQAAVAKAPSALAPRLIRGQVHGHFGRIDEAAADFAWVLQRAPAASAAWWALARLRKQTLEDNHVAELRSLLGRPDAKPVDTAALGYALHKELDDLGEFDGAWQALEQACKAKRASLQYTVDDSRRLVDDLAGMPFHAPATKADAIAKIPVFIVGMHRSGTTLLEQLLDGSQDVQGVGELYDFTSVMRYATDHHCKGVIDRTIAERAKDVDYAEVGRRYLDGMAWRLGDARFFTDKLPSNFLNIGFICRALPQAKILHMVRDPVETCFSNLRELFSDANPYSYDQLELADYFIQYRRLMAHWHAVHPGRILDVDYAALTRDPAATMREVAAFCGIDYVDAMSDPRSSSRAVSTASAVQVRDKVVRREVPKWAPYAGYLQPLIGALREGGVEVPGLPA